MEDLKEGNNMKTMREILTIHAGVLDSQHRPNQPIRVQGTRAYLRQWFKPEGGKRGAPLMLDGHPLIVVPRFQAAPLDQSDLVTAEDEAANAQVSP